MPWPVHPTGFFGAQGDNDTYKIDRSLRFNSADSATLDRTPSNSGNRTAWTQSFWIKRSKLGTEQHLFESGGANFQTFFDVNDCFRWYENGSYIAITTQVFRDTSAWYHFVLTWDSANATAGDRFRIYVNGVRVTSFSTTSNPNLNQSSGWNQASTAHYFGRYNASALYYFDGYLTEAYFIDGQTLTPSSFGETDAITGRWKAKAYSGTYGTNGFYLKFADNSGTTSTTLGKDSSGNGNNWTPNNFSVTAGAGNDSLLDSPTNSGTSGNYCTLNSLAYSEASVSFSEGNLRATVASGNMQVIGTMPFSGKTYIEYTALSSNNGQIVFSPDSNAGQTMYFNLTNRGIILNDGTSSVSGSVSFTINSGSLFSWTTNDIIGVAYDTATNVVILTKNGGSSVNITVNGIGASQVFPLYTNRTSASATTVLLNTGQRDFNTAAPSGFKALCTTNLPTPTIKKPSSYFDVKTWTATGTDPLVISGLGFSPDLVWAKARSDSYNHVIVDQVRGVNNVLSSNLTNAEANYTTITQFNSDGFNAGGTTNNNYSLNCTVTAARTYVAWAWDEAPIAGMDIVSYTGNGTSGRTVSHSLGVKPAMMIAKNRSTSSRQWVVWHRSLSSDSHYLFLDSTAAQANTFSEFQGSSSTTFTIGNDNYINFNGDNYIAYLFAEVEGFSKFGSYTGNGSADGPFVWCGFRPRWVMVKRSDGGAVNWWIFDAVTDSFNVISKGLSANTADAESSGNTWADMTSNGIKIRTTSAGANASGGTYIFCAFSESPFKYSRAR